MSHKVRVYGKDSLVKEILKHIDFEETTFRIRRVSWQITDVVIEKEEPKDDKV